MSVDECSHSHPNMSLRYIPEREIIKSKDTNFFFKDLDIYAKKLCVQTPQHDIRATTSSLDIFTLIFVNMTD